MQQKVHGCIYLWLMALVARMEWPEGHRLAFWQLEKDERTPITADEACFTDDDRRELERYQHDKRRREWHASRMALRSGLASNEPVLYLPNGKPHLKDAALSFSHCLPLAGALLHPHLAGMDIQSCDEKIFRIRTKFANREELLHADRSDDTLDYLTILWSAKESIFKVYGEQLNFADGIRVAPFKPGDAEITATIVRIDRQTTHRLRVFRVLDHWVVCVLD